MSRPGLLLASLVIVAAASPAAAAEPDLSQDGWYRWEVAAGRGGQKACCYNYHGGRLERTACRLGDGKNEFAPAGDCDVLSDSMQVFVEVREGRAEEIRALSNACPVRADSRVTSIENVSVADSIAWLKRQAVDNSRVADEAIMTVSFHPQQNALEALFGLLEDTSLARKVREQALFWLVQSDYDEAIAYIDRLLD